MYQGQCAFSGWMIPRGSGLHRVGNDNKVVFAMGKKEHNFLSRKISPRIIKWTETSRSFFNKSHKNVTDKHEFIPITKIVRGFSMIPKALLSEEAKQVQKKDNNRNTHGQNTKSFKNINSKSSNFGR
ncbi:hypothetical protein PAEPH01_1910 [Pancytospora epiphaga]|nr:hypothetical protein PAEPH01_1910 [Pancytospora epiphaga]